MSIKQANRSISIKTPLGADVLGLRSFSVQEQISRLFQIEAEMASDNGQIKLDDVVGHDITIQMKIGEGDERYFHGFVSRMVQTGSQGDFHLYRATIVPWLWFLTRTSDCRIWVATEDPGSGQTVPDIIKAVFQFHGFSDYKLNLSGTYPKREFVVQYRETDFNFVSRLMEQEGIYYFFEHKDGKHTLVLADSKSAHNPFPNYAEIVFNEARQGAADREEINDWTLEKEVHPVKTALNDYNFTTPKASLLAKTDTERKHAKAQYEIYDYPGEYVDAGAGGNLAQVRLDELQSQYELLHGQASARGLAAGCTFELKDHPRNDQNREYLITGVSLHASAGEFDSKGAGESEFFSCSFSCIDKKQQFRPARLTPKPVVQGPQTAMVVGPAGEEIYTDKYGRVKVHFYWDRHDQSDQNSSCWVRVSQYWAGKTWGTIHIPRINQEVVVEFLEGDPDRPIITGRVYNADQMPPYSLPGNKTQSGIKSNSSKGGGGSNEIRFEDLKGSEEVYIHAQKDQNIKVEHDETTTIGNNRTETVGKDESITINGNRTETVAKDESITINGGRTETVAKDESISINGGRTEEVAKDEDISIDGGRTESVGKDENITIGGGRTESVTKDENITISGGRTESVGQNESVSVTGGRTVTVGKDDGLQVTNNLNIQAGQSITITCGSASITLNSSGTIQINGSDIDIEGSGKIQLKASSDLIMKGSSVAAN
jgi:type VI secretion system secreted protein VgrG